MSLNMSKSIVLTYLDIKGIAEPIRITLFSGGIEFEDERIGYEEIARRRSEGILPHGQLPTLQAPGFDGLLLSQSRAILHWVRRMRIIL
jgi:prostaglandin-H2 D-isomerase / glutathione transferase